MSPIPQKRTLHLKSTKRALLALMLLLLCTHPALPETPEVTPTPVSPLQEITDRAPIRLDGTVLFYVRSGGDFSAQERAALFGERLSKLVKSGEKPTVEVAKIGKSSVVRVGKTVFTVSLLDMEESQMSSEEVASIWATRLREALDKAVDARSPESLKRSAVSVGGLFIVTLLIHLWLGYRWRQAEKKNREDPPPTWKLYLYRFFLWGFWMYYGLFTVPYTRHLFKPFLKADTIAIVSVLLVILIQLLLERLLRKPLAEFLAGQRSDPFRIDRRTSAILGFFKGCLSALILVVGFVALLDSLGVSTGPFLTSVGLVGLVIGFAAQNLVKDILGGLLILKEDKFGIGDWVCIRGHSGEVIGLSLHVTTLRNLAGDIITIPNGTLDTTINYTQDWSSIDFTVTISHDSDLDKAIEALKASAKTLREQNPDTVLAEAEVLGVDNIGELGVDLRILVRVEPGQQWVLTRALREILLREFSVLGIRSALRRLHLEKSGETSPPG